MGDGSELLICLILFEICIGWISNLVLGFFLFFKVMEGRWNGLFYDNLRVFFIVDNVFF